MIKHRTSTDTPQVSQGSDWLPSGSYVRTTM